MNVEGDERFDDDAAASWLAGPPADRAWRHPSEIGIRVVTVEATPSVAGGSHMRTLVVSFSVALVVSIAATAVATIFVSSRRSTVATSGGSYPVTTIDERLEHFTLAVDTGTGRHSFPALVLDGVGTIVTTLAGAREPDPASTSNGAPRAARATQSQLALLHGSTAAPISPLGSCQSLKVGSPLQVMTAGGSTTGTITSLDMVPMDDADDPSTPVVIVRTAGTLDATNSLLWQDGKIVAIGVRRKDDGQLIAIPTDVAIGLARAAASSDSDAMPWLGIGGSDEHDGVRVGSVAGGSPADGRLMIGDTIVAIDGQPVMSMWSLAVELRRFSAQDTIELRVVTAGQTHNLKVTLSAKAHAAAPTATTTSSPTPATTPSQ